MKEKSAIHSPCLPHKRIFGSGLTLIEVVAGLALLGTLLTTIVLAKAKYIRQGASANRRMRAVLAADSLLTSWWQDLASFPRASTGQINGDQPLIWQTRLMDHETVPGLVADVVRLEIIEGNKGEKENQTLVTVDVMIPVEMDEDEESLHDN